MAYASEMALTTSFGFHYREIEMDKTDKKPEQAKPEQAKPESATPALKQARWPGQGNNGGIRNAKSVHDRKPTGRGAARGR